MEEDRNPSNFIEATPKKLLIFNYFKPIKRLIINKKVRGTAVKRLFFLTFLVFF